MEVKLPFGSAKPNMERTSDMKMDGMAEVPVVSSQPATSLSPSKPTDMLKAGHKDLSSQIPVKK